MGYHCLTPSVRLTTMDVSEISSTCNSDLTHLQLFSISDCNRHAGELHRSVVMDADYLRSTSLPPDEGNCQFSMACIAHMLKSDCGLQMLEITKECSESTTRATCSCCNLTCMSAAASQPHLQFLSVQRDTVAHIKGVNHEDEDDCLKCSFYRGSKYEREAQENAREQHPCVANIYLSTCRPPLSAVTS